MKRRQALSGIGLLAGGSLILPNLVLTGCTLEPHPYPLFTWGDTELINELGEIILPTTADVPGAKAADVGDFTQRFISDCLSPQIQQAVLAGYVAFKLEGEQALGKPFVELSEDQKKVVVADLELTSAEQVFDELGEPVLDEDGQPIPHFYGIMKNIIVFGYYSSEIGATEALAYVPIPGSQKGIIPYAGEKAWAL
jgi:hypothetical protein